MGLCRQTGPGSYTASSKTKILTVPQGTSSFTTWSETLNRFFDIILNLVAASRFDLCMPAAAKLPEYLRANNYQNPREAARSTFSYAFEDEFWSYLKGHSELSATFNQFMATRRQGRPSWFDVYPVETELASGMKLDNDIPLLVDIGGNQGHDLLNLKSQHSRLEGQLILQDLPEVIAQVDLADNGIKAMSHDFFTPQPVKSRSMQKATPSPSSLPRAL